MNIENIGAVIFDKDGTLFDTEKSIYFPAHQETISTFGGHGRDYTLDYHLGFRGTSTEARFGDLQKVFKLAVDVPTLVKTYRSIYMLMIEQRGITPLEGVREFLEYLEGGMLRQTGTTRLAVFTSSTSKNAEYTLTKSGLDQYFATVVTVDDLTRGNEKPHPEGYLLTADRLGVNPQKCIVIGDGWADIVGAKRAKMQTILLQDPNHPVMFENSDRPDLVITSFRQLLS